MAWYSFVRDERLIGFGLMAAATVGLYVGVRAALQPYHASSVVYPLMPKTQYITQDTEDSLSLLTLNSLLDHYNFSIRETAAKIVCDRAINDDATLGRLLQGIGRPAYDERMTSLRALAMLTDQNTLHRLNTKEGFAAFVRSLEQCVATDKKEGADTETEEGSMIDDIYFDEYYLRDIAEKLCLMFLAQLTDKFDVDLLVRVGFVDRWLAKQRWGPPAARIDNFARYLKHRDNRIADICRRLEETPVGRSALEKANLVEPLLASRRAPQSLHHKQLELLQLQLPPSPLDAPLRLDLRSSPLLTNGTNGTSGTGDALPPRGIEAVEVATENTGNGDAEAGAATVASVVRSARAVLGALDMLGGDENSAPETTNGVAADGSADGADDDAHTAAGGPNASTRTRQSRPPSQSSREEQRIRRQHREAMVLNDGTRPLRRDDIFERESD